MCGASRSLCFSCAASAAHFLFVERSNIMKRTLSLLLALVLCLSLCSCAFDEDYLDSNGLDSSQHNETDATEEIHVHHWNDATCKTPKTCSSCGATDGDILPHSWKNATCTSPKKCTACGDTEGNPLSHFWIDPTCTTPKTCSSCGKTTAAQPGIHTITENVPCAERQILQTLITSRYGYLPMVVPNII